MKALKEIKMAWGIEWELYTAFNLKVVLHNPLDIISSRIPIVTCISFLSSPWLWELHSLSPEKAFLLSFFQVCLFLPMCPELLYTWDGHWLVPEPLIILFTENVPFCLFSCYSSLGKSVLCQLRVCRVSPPMFSLPTACYIVVINPLWAFLASCALILFGNASEAQGPLFFVGHALARLSLRSKQIAFCRET